jgi:hypothetical protein
MPAPKPDADVSLQDSKQDTQQQMKDAEVTPQQLQKANDPRFSAVLSAQDAVAKQADAGPGQYRAAEKGVAAGAAAAAIATAGKGAAAMVGVKRGANSTVLTKQQQAKLKDEQARQKVVQQIEDVYNRTKASVESKLANLETEVGSIFDAGVDAALNAMTEFVESRLTRYKLERYLLKPFGAALWIKDQFMGLPDEVNAFYQQGRTLFTGLMDNLVVRVANLVERKLKEAKDEVKKGQAEIQKIVDSQPKELRGVAESAQKDVAGRFEELERGIEDKKNSLAQALADKYKEAFDKANEALKKIQDDNKGLVQAFAEKLGEVIKILTEFKNKLMALLKKGADTIKLILADPIGFLGNLIAAIKLGLNQFIANIWTHLKKGFFMWLFGALAEAGIEIPSGLPSLPALLQLVLSVLGITYERMRAKAVKLIGERAVTVIETLGKYIKVLIEGGPAKLWEQIKSDLSDLKGMVIDAIQSYIVTTVAQRAIAKLVTMFNPAGAIIQAVLAIYDTVMFLIEKAQQIMALVEAVINSVNAIATGAISGAANWIEQALARTIPVVIGFLAQFVGLGKISKKIKEFIQKVQAKVDAAIDKAIAKVVAVVKKLAGKLTGRKDAKPDDRTDAQKQADLDRGVGEADALLAQKDADPDEVRKKLPAIKAKYKMTSLELVSDQKAETQETGHIEGDINPNKKAPKHILTGKDAEYAVGFHPVTAPASAGKKKGESHHVPYKVLGRWFGEIMQLAGNALLKSASTEAEKTHARKVKTKGDTSVADETGNGLSAIWLTKKAHDLAHASAKPGELTNLRGDFVVTKEDDDVSSRPMRGVIARSVHEQVVGPASNASTKKRRNFEIFKAREGTLRALFQNVFESGLSAGIALVNRMKLKDDNWPANLRGKARSSWRKFWNW